MATHKQQLMFIQNIKTNIEQCRICVLAVNTGINLNIPTDELPNIQLWKDKLEPFGLKIVNGPNANQLTILQRK